MAIFIIFLVIVLIVIVMYRNEIFRGSFKVQVVKFLPLGIFKEDKKKDMELDDINDSKIDNREDNIKDEHSNKEKDSLHNNRSKKNEIEVEENKVELNESEIEVKEIESDERNIEINEKEQEKTYIEHEYGNISDLKEEKDYNLLNRDEIEIVYWTPNGKTYHSKSTCRTLSRSKIINSGTVNESGKDFKCENCK